MRVFLCPYAGFYAAIPMDCVESLILYKSAAEKIIVSDLINNNTFISLPLLFQNPEAVIRHGLILKNGNNDDVHDEFKNKTILLTTEVECEKEFPQQIIYPVPKIFSTAVHSPCDFGFSSLFNGISFNIGSSAVNTQALTLFLNAKEFSENIETKINSMRTAA